MTKFTIFPKIVKVLHEYYGRQVWNGYCDKRVEGHTLTIGTYYVAEHGKTAGLDKGDAFIIKTHYLD